MFNSHQNSVGRAFDSYSRYGSEEKPVGEEKDDSQKVKHTPASAPYMNKQRSVDGSQSFEQFVCERACSNRDDQSGSGCGPLQGYTKEGSQGSSTSGYASHVDSRLRGSFHEQQDMDDRAYNEQRTQTWVDQITPKKDKDYDIHPHENALDTSAEKQLNAMAAQIKLQESIIEKLSAQLNSLLAEVEKRNVRITQLQGQLNEGNEAAQPSGNITPLQGQLNEGNEAVQPRGSDAKPVVRGQVEGQSVRQQTEHASPTVSEMSKYTHYNAPYVLQSQPYGYGYPLYTPMMPVIPVYNMVPASVTFGGFVQSYSYTGGFGVLPVMYGF
ncbi:hypothetical protein N9V90_00930 [Endozoicomonas sp.]|nr:hypothetical protein [Endozoicomonas sp.]